MNIVENGVNYNVKRYNDLKIANERLVVVLKTKLDALEQQKNQFEQLDSMKKATTEEGIRIEQLQKETSQCEQEIREKTHYLRKLDHMLHRLKNNQVNTIAYLYLTSLNLEYCSNVQLKFDAHMVGMEDTMRSIVKDGNEVRLMRRGLDAGLAKAIMVYEETKAT